jgi:hypothetical protein
MKRKTKSTQFSKIADGYHQLKRGERPRPVPACIKTQPIIPVPDKPEAEVLAECLDWLKKHRIWARRMNVGAGVLGRSFVSFGIVGSADITGILPDGRRLEIETKKGKGGWLSEEQLKYKKDIQENNGIYLIVHGLAELEMLMESYI